MFNYAIGLDIGTTSVGWATVALDEKETPCGILGMGVRIFDAAENPKDGSSLASKRREARSARRRVRRHNHRIERIRNLLVNSNVITESELEKLFSGKLEDIYTLRVRALDELVDGKEFSRILINLAQRRGFKSNRKNPTDKEEGLLLGCVEANKKRMADKGYRTPGEMFLKDKDYAEHKRNKGEEYLATVSRDMIIDEAKKIIEAQRTLGSPFATEEFENKYIEILSSQRNFDEGPGGESPYGGDQISRMRGICEFEKEQSRAPKCSYSFEYFRLLQEINHIRLVKGNTSLPLNNEQREAIKTLAHKKDSFTYDDIRKTLKIEEDYLFNKVYYREAHTPAEIKECEKKTKVPGMKGYNELRKALNSVSKEAITGFSRKQLNDIAEVLTIKQTADNRRAGLEALGLESYFAEALVDVSGFNKFGHLSALACDKIIPFLEQGMNYNEACNAAGYDFKSHNDTKKDIYLKADFDNMPEITSPVVKRSVSQTIKVINAIIRERGCSPMFVNVELAREMSKSFDERNKIKKENETNKAANDRIKNRIQEDFKLSDVKGQDILKLKLYEEQGGICAYSLKPISYERLFEANYVEIDHIVPYSISFDDSFKNKVLVFAGENRQKGNRVPLEYLTGKRRDDFIVWTNANVRNTNKKRLLLKEHITEEDKKSLKERSLQDTKFATKFMRQFIEDHLIFAESKTGRKKRVTAVNGAVTDHMRKRWGIVKIRENGDTHHAVDALVIACTTDGLIQKVSRYSEYREIRYTKGDNGSSVVDKYTGEVIDKFPYPWPEFRTELDIRLANDPKMVATVKRIPFYDNNVDVFNSLKPIFVSRMPKRGVRGEAHEATIRSAKDNVIFAKGYVISKVPLADLNLDKTGEIKGYYKPESDRPLYEALKQRLEEYGGNAEKAFAGEFRKPKSDGTDGPIVKRVKIIEKSPMTVPVLVDESDNTVKAVANHSELVRIDIFKIEGDGYYFVPIYVADTLRDELPSKGCVGSKPYSDWKDMDDKDFLFSLYQNDLIKIEAKDGINFKKTKVAKKGTLPDECPLQSAFVYYKGADRDSARIEFLNHDNTYEARKGIKTLVSLEKYSVDILGNITPVKKEKRLPFEFKRR